MYRFIVIIKSEISTFPLLSYFLWLCAWGGFTTICCRFHIYPWKAGSCVFHYGAVLWCVQIIEYIMSRWPYSFICTWHYPVIIIMATYLMVLGFQKCLLGIFCLECVFKIKKISSIIFNAINGDVRIQLTHSCYDCENACTLCYYHHQIGSMTHLALFRVKSWNNGMRFMSFYIFTYSQDHGIKHITKIKLC